MVCFVKGKKTLSKKVRMKIDLRMRKKTSETSTQGGIHVYLKSYGCFLCLLLNKNTLKPHPKRRRWSFHLRKHLVVKSITNHLERADGLPLPCIGLSWPLTFRHLLGVASHLLLLECKQNTSCYIIVCVCVKTSQPSNLGTLDLLFHINKKYHRGEIFCLKKWSVWKGTNKRYH